MDSAILDYKEFLQQKTHEGAEDGFDPIHVPDSLFDFQQDLTAWALKKGRAALFEDCGLGKTPQQLVWADNVYRYTNKPVLILVPLAVSAQTIREADKFEIEAKRSQDGSVPGGVVITNYERLHYFDPSHFSGLVCDESSILKSFDGRRRNEITQFMRKIPYRLLCTATAAPNDYTELGTSSEALGYMGHMDMLSRFFRNVDNTSSTRMHQFRFKHKEKAEAFMGTGQMWRFKGHAELPYWRWVCSWARALRKPSDLGYDDNGFKLPKLTERNHIVEAKTLADGMLFPLPAVGLKEQREERQRTIKERCEQVASLVSDTGKPALVWCHLNDEGDLLESLIQDAVQISGKNSDEEKEERIMAFADKQIRVLVTKPKIGAWGLNFQHCSHITYFPSHSYEQYYQSIRRCWRFGQKKPVTVDIVATEGDQQVMKNLHRKSKQAEQMFTRLIEEMHNAMDIGKIIDFPHNQKVPKWL